MVNLKIYNKHYKEKNFIKIQYFRFLLKFVKFNKSILKKIHINNIDNSNLNFFNILEFLSSFKSKSFSELTNLSNSEKESKLMKQISTYIIIK